MDSRRSSELEGELCANAFVVNVQLYQENHKIVHLFTRDYGKLSCFARNATRSKKRFGSQIDTGNTVRAFVEKSKTKLWLLNKVELVEMPLVARSRLSNVDVIFFLLSALKDLYPEEHADEVFYDLVDQSLKRLEEALSAQQLSWLKLSVAYWLQAHLGYGDEIDFLQEALSMPDEDFDFWKSLRDDGSFLDKENLKKFEAFPKINSESVKMFYNNWKEVTRLNWSYFEKV